MFGRCALFTVMIVGLVVSLGCVAESRAREATKDAWSPLPPVKDFPPVDQLPSRPDPPDALTTFDGRPIRTADAWRRIRRPELADLFQHYMYGYLPPPPKNVTWRLESVDRSFFGGKATKKEVAIQFGPPDAPLLHLLVVIPNRRSGPAPVFLMLNRYGNQSVTNEPGVRITTSWVADQCPGVENNRAGEASRGAEAQSWCVENTIDRGFALATFHQSDVAPDTHNFEAGVFPHFRREGQTEHGPHDWGTLAAWAFGLHRAVDYLTADDDIDNNRICLTGHSRRGKTALLAAALDERISLVIPHQAGCGGTSLSRHKNGESVAQVNRFTHWFTATFRQFNDREDLLPFDQHLLIAMCAPRPVLLTNAVDDNWADPPGQFLALQGADPVYRLIAGEGLQLKEMPEPEVQDFGRLSFYIRPGRHSVTLQDWNAFLDYAEKRLGKQAAPANAAPSSAGGQFGG